MKHSAALLVAILLFNACRHGHTAGNEKPDTVKSVNKAAALTKQQSERVEKDTPITINLKYGFKIAAANSEYLGPNSTYSHLELWHNNVKVFTDTIEEYEFAEKQYPILNQLSPGVFELLVEFNDRPLDDKLTFLRIENDRITRRDTIPTFEGKPEEINGVTECYGQLDASEVVERNGREYTTYDPTLYYKFTPDGLKLDSGLTIKKNTEKYGKFCGFKYYDKTLFHLTKNGGLDTIQNNPLKR
jgi:hypothetical protein